ncbi:sulfite oxidase-like oxidoreductase [Chloroflexota bacterium]
MNEPVISSDTLRDNRIPPGQKLTDKWPVLHIGGVPSFEINKWKFSIFGLVSRKVELDYNQFLELPGIKVYSDIHCVTRWSKLDNLWEGVSSGILRELTDIDPQADFAIIHASQGFTTNLSLHDFFQPDVLFAFTHNGAMITPEHGYPLRLIVPKLYLWKSAKWITGIEFTAEDRPGFWETHGYHIHGDPWKEERYTTP